MKKHKLLVTAVCITAMCLAVTGCSKSEDSSGVEDSKLVEQGTTGAQANSQKAQQLATSVSYSTVDEGEADCKITFNGSSAKCEGSGAAWKEGVLTISKEGRYEISGELDDGRIEVNATKDDKIQIILNGVNISCSDYAPFVVLQADETDVYLTDGTINIFRDGGSYYTENSADSSSNTEDEIPSATIFSKDDLGFLGGGTLIVEATCNDGITGKDDVWFDGGVYQITSEDDGIIGKDSIAVKSGTFVIEAGGDGMKSTEDTDTEKGFVTIENGTFSITSENDGIQAETYVLIADGEFELTTGDGAGNVTSDTGMMDRWGQNAYSQTDDSTSSKGIKAGVDVTIQGGTITMDCADDTIHSNDSVNVNGGTLRLSAGDDGIHGDTAVVIADGTIVIEQSYEGVEGESIIMKGGKLELTASDDGFNAANGDSTEGMDGPGGMGGQPEASSSSTGSLSIEGGDIYVNAGGDALDANGFIYMSGGTALVDGPTNNGNGTLDYDKEFVVTGGILMGAGSSGMMQAASSNSTQGSMALALGGNCQAGTEVVIKDSNGNEIISYTPAKTFSAIIVSCPELEVGETYEIVISGNSLGAVKLSSVSVSNGSNGMGGGQGGHGGNMSGGRRMY